MKSVAFGVAVALLSGCTTLYPTADQVVDESGNWSVIESEDATIAISYAGKKSARPVFVFSVTNHSDDTLILEPQVIRYFASTKPFVPVEQAPDDWMELSAQNSKLPMTMHFAVDPRSVTKKKKNQERRQEAVWRVVPPNATIEEVVFLHKESLRKYYRVVVPVSGNYYVFDFERNSNGEVEAEVVSALLEALIPW